MMELDVEDTDSRIRNRITRGPCAAVVWNDFETRQVERLCQDMTNSGSSRTCLAREDVRERHRELGEFAKDRDLFHEVECIKSNRATGSGEETNVHWSCTVSDSLAGKNGDANKHADIVISDASTTTTTAW